MWQHAPTVPAPMHVAPSSSVLSGSSHAALHPARHKATSGAGLFASSTEEALQAVKSLKARGHVASLKDHTAALNALSRHGLWREAADLLREMRSAALEPG
ncbi:unnamed protein product, partial [Polarella glacialis]